MKLRDIRNHPEGIAFEESPDVKTALSARDKTIIDVTNLTAKGLVTFDDDLYLLNYQLSYELTIPSTRSMEPVTIPESYDVSEVFIAAADVAEKADLVEEHLVMVVEGDQLDLSESIIDNILLNIPSKVLTEDEKDAVAMPQGNDWAVLTQEQYEAMRQAEKEENSPFASLSGLFTED